MNQNKTDDVLRQVSRYIDQLEEILGDEQLLEHPEVYLEKTNLVMGILKSLEDTDSSVSFNGYNLTHYIAKSLTIQGTILMLSAVNQREQALSKLNEAISICPELSGAHASIAILHMHDRNLELARKHMRCATELEPDNPKFERMLDSLEHITEKDLDEIKSQQFNMPGDDPTVAKKLTLSEELLKSGKVYDSIVVLKSVVESATFDEDRMFAAGLICSTYAYHVLNGQNPESGTSEFEDIRKYLRIALEIYEKVDGPMKRNFAQIHDIEGLKSTLEMLDEESV